VNIAKRRPYETSRINARWAGVFYVLATAAPILTFPFIGFLGGGSAGEPTPDYLVEVSVRSNQVVLGTLIELTYALSVVGIVVTLFPILKKHHETLALGFSGLRFMEAIGVMIHSLILLSLLTLSQEYAVAGFPSASYFRTAGALFLAARDWTFLVASGIVWSLSALVLNALLFQKKLVPRWLSGWGLVGALLSLVAYSLQFFSIHPSEFLFLPIGVQEMVFAVWLIVKGTNHHPSYGSNRWK
jgi:hypothetical protein